MRKPKKTLKEAKTLYDQKLVGQLLDEVDEKGFVKVRQEHPAYYAFERMRGQVVEAGYVVVAHTGVIPSYDVSLPEVVSNE